MLASRATGWPSLVAPGPGGRPQRVGPALAALDQLGPGGGIRVDEHLTGGAVDGQDRPDADGDRTGQLHDRGNAHLRGQDRGVAGRAAGLGDDGQHQVASQAGRLRRGQVVGHDHARFGELGHARVLQAEEPGHGPVAHVAQVRDAFGEVATGRAEHGAVLLCRSVHGRGRAATAGQVLVRRGGQTGVTGHHRGGGQDLLRRRVGPGGAVIQGSGDRLEDLPDQLP